MKKMKFFKGSKKEYCIQKKVEKSSKIKQLNMFKGIGGGNHPFLVFDLILYSFYYATKCFLQI